MTFTVRLRPIRGYDFEEIRRLVNEWVPDLDDDAERQPQSVSVPFDESTIQFWRRKVSVVVRTEDPTAIIRFVYMAACAASGVSPGFEVTSYDLRGTEASPTVGAIFTAFMEGQWDGGDVSEPARLWGRELGRMCLVEMAVQDQEARIREEGPEAVLADVPS